MLLLNELVIFVHYLLIISICFHHKVSVLIMALSLQLGRLFTLEWFQTFLDINDFQVNVAHYRFRQLVSIIINLMCVIIVIFVNSIIEITAYIRGAIFGILMMALIMAYDFIRICALLRLVMSRFRLRSFLCSCSSWRLPCEDTRSVNSRLAFEDGLKLWLFLILVLNHLINLLNARRNSSIAILSMKLSCIGIKARLSYLILLE